MNIILHCEIQLNVYPFSFRNEQMMKILIETRLVINHYSSS